jgi:hypothetical protein
MKQDELIVLRPEDVTLENLEQIFEPFSFEYVYIDDDDDTLNIEVEELEDAIQITINQNEKLITFSCVLDASEKLPFKTKLMIVNELNLSIPFVKFCVPTEKDREDCIYAVGELAFFTAISVLELANFLSSFISALVLTSEDSDFLRLNSEQNNKLH